MKIKVSDLRTVIAETVRDGAVAEMASKLTSAATQLSTLNVKRVPKDVAQSVAHGAAELKAVAEDLTQFAQGSQITNKRYISYDRTLRPRTLGEIANIVQGVANNLSSLENTKRMRSADTSWLAELADDLYDMAAALTNLGSGGKVRSMSWDADAKAYRKNRYIDEA